MIRACAASLVAALAAALLASPALAHRLSPAFFGLTETAPGIYAVQWKVSISGGLASALEPKVPQGCSLTGDVRTYVVNEDVRFQHAVRAEHPECIRLRVCKPRRNDQSCQGTEHKQSSHVRTVRKAVV